jgi:hypothetical protein
MHHVLLNHPALDVEMGSKNLRDGLNADKHPHCCAKEIPLKLSGYLSSSPVP